MWCSSVVQFALILVISCFNVPDVKEFFEKVRFVHQHEMDGHRILTEIDTFNNQPVQETIYAVQTEQGIVFSNQQPNKQNCITFAVPNMGPREYCKQFMVVHQDFMKLHRRPFSEFKASQDHCTQLGKETLKENKYIALLRRLTSNATHWRKVVGNYDISDDIYLGMRDSRTETLDHLMHSNGTFNIENLEVLCWEDYGST